MKWQLAIKVKTAPAGKMYQKLYPFNEDEVKVGNLKDPEKIEAKIKEAKEDYEAESDSQACLSSLTGKICAIAVVLQSIKGDKIDQSLISYYTNKDESKLLEDFWSAMVNFEKDFFQPGDSCRIVTWGDFDIPFIFQRSVIVGQSSQGCTLFPSMDTYNTFKQNGRAPAINLMKIWSCNSYSHEKLWFVGAALGLVDPDSKEFKEYLSADQAKFYKLLDTQEGEVEAMKQLQKETSMITSIANLVL